MKKILVVLLSLTLIFAFTGCTSSNNGATEDIEVTLGLSPKSLEVYNTKSGTNYKSMPEGSYSFDQKTVVIKRSDRSKVKIRKNMRIKH